MAKLRIHNFTISLDGFGAGVDQSATAPFGVGGNVLNGWQMKTRAFHEMLGKKGGDTGLDNDLVNRGLENIGAFIMGRNMFGPIRGAWEDDNWKGWWGPNPPYHTPVFVLTNHPRDPVEMEGDTIFHFVTDGIETALDRAFASAGDADVRLGGGVDIIRQYLHAGLVDEAHFAISPILLGKGEALFSGLDLNALGYKVLEHVNSQEAAHFVIGK